MLQLSCNWEIALSIVFAIFLVRAYWIDFTQLQQHKKELENCSSCNAISRLDTRTPEGFHAAVVETIQNEQHKTHSHVHRLLSTARDQVIRGALMGAIGGSFAEVIHNMVTWSLVGGIVTGCGDLMAFKGA